MRVFPPALRRNVGYGAFQNLEKRLLHTLPGNVAGDRWVFVLAADLIDFVDINDALLALLDIAVGRLEQLEDDVLDILADVPGLGQGGGVHNREGNVENLR